MALSGYDEQVSGNSHYKIRVEWSATQNIVNNYSTVTATLKFWSDSSWDINVSNRSGYVQIDGTTYDFTYSLNSSGGKWVTLHTSSKTVYHNADGTKSLTVKGNYNFGITINGSALGSPVATYSGSLDTIPRSSSVTSAVSWTAGTQNLSISVNSAVSSFTHKAMIYVQTPAGAWNYIGETPANFAKSTTMTFNSTHITRMYQAINGYENRPAKVVLYTYSGSTQIGSTTEKLGTIYGVSIGKATFNNFNIGNNLPITVSPVYAGFTYTAVMTFGGFSKTWSLTTPSSGSSISATLTFTTADINSMYAAIPNANTGVGNLEITTQYNGVDVNDGAPSPTYNPNKSFFAYVVNSNPTFSGTGVTYYDNNSVTRTVTGSTNPYYIVQNKSKLQIQIPLDSKASAINSATMVRYEAVVAGKTYTANYSSTAQVNIDCNEVNLSTDTTIQVYAVDSRGNKTAYGLPVKALPYAAPTMVVTAARANSFDADTTISVSGVASTLTISGANKNAITLVKYEYKVKGAADTTYVATSITPTVTGFPSYVGSSVVQTLQQDTSFDVRLTVQDNIGTYTTVKNVPAGIPILFVDSVKNSVGIGMLPIGIGTFEAAGGIFANRTEPVLTTKILGNTDINTVDASGFYIFNGTSMTNSPLPPSNWFYLLNIKYNSTNRKQIVYDFNNTDKSFIRTQSTGTWGSWQQFMTDGDLVWTTATYQNGWSSLDSGRALRYTKWGNIGIVEGTVLNSGTPKSTLAMCTLPTGYRPTQMDWVALCMTQGAFGTEVTVKTDGSVVTSAWQTAATGQWTHVRVIFPIG